MAAGSNRRQLPHMRFTSTRQRQPISNSAPDVFLQLFLYPLGPVFAEGRNDIFIHLLGVLGQVRQRVNRLQQRGTGQELASRSWFHRKKTNSTTERETGLMGRACASPARQHKVDQQQHAKGPRSGPPTLFSIVRYSTTRLWRGSVRGASNSSVQPGWNLGGMGMFWGCAQHASTDTLFLLAAAKVKVHVQPRAMLSRPSPRPP